MAVERWIEITVCHDDHPNAGQIVDGLLWLTSEQWAQVREHKRIKIIHKAPVVITTDYTRET